MGEATHECALNISQAFDVELKLVLPYFFYHWFFSPPRRKSVSLLQKIAFSQTVPMPDWMALSTASKQCIPTLGKCEWETYDRRCRSVCTSWRAPTGWRSQCQTPPWNSALGSPGQSHHSTEPANINKATLSATSASYKITVLWKCAELHLKSHMFKYF